MLVSPIDLKTGKDLETLAVAESVAAQDDFASVLLNASVDGVIGYNLEMRYTLWSPAMERISGMSRDSVIGRHAFEVFPFMRDHGIEELYLASFRGETARSALQPFLVPETGRAGFYEQQNFPMFDEFRNVIGGVAVVRDMTGIVDRYEALTRVNRQLEERETEMRALLDRIRGGGPSSVDCARASRGRPQTLAASGGVTLSGF